MIKVMFSCIIIGLLINYNITMKHRSELVQLEIPDPSTKKNQTYFTYDGYYKEEDRVCIHQNRRKIEQRTFGSAAFMGVLFYYASTKANMPIIPVQGYRIPTKGLISGVCGYVGGFFLFDQIGTYQAADFQKGIAIGSHHLPLWRDKNAAVNPDRVYFELIDSSNNELSIFHSGLTPLSAEKLIPDKILGQLPTKPTIYEGHSANH